MAVPAESAKTVSDAYRRGSGSDTHFPDYEPDDWESVFSEFPTPMRRTLTAIALRFWSGGN